MFGIGTWELVIIFAIVLLVFGGKRLPELASGLGAAIRNFKAAAREPNDVAQMQPQLTAKPLDMTEGSVETKVQASI